MRELHLDPRDPGHLGHQESILLAENALSDIIDDRGTLSGFKKSVPLKVNGRRCDAYVTQLCERDGDRLYFAANVDLGEGKKKKGQGKKRQHFPYAAASVIIVGGELDANFLHHLGLDVEFVTGRKSGSISLFLAMPTVPGAYGSSFSIDKFIKSFFLPMNDVVDFLWGRDWSTEAGDDVQRFLRESYCLEDDLEQRVIDCSQLYFEHQDRVAQLFPRTGAPGDYEVLPSNHYWPNLMPLHLNEFWLPNNRTVQAVAKMRRRVLLPSPWRPGQTVIVPAWVFGEGWALENPGEYAGTIIELAGESAEEGRTWLVKYAKEGEPHPTDERFFVEAPPWCRPTTHVAMEDSEPEADAGADGTDDAMEADAAPAEDAVMAEAVPAPEAMPTPRIRLTYKGETLGGRM